MKLLILILAILVCSTGITEERVLGYDQLALQHPKFSTKKAFEFTPSGSALGTLDFTFGSSLSSIRASLHSGRYSIFRVHILNTVCVRNGNCGKYEPLNGFTVNSLSNTLEKISDARTQKILKHLRTRLELYKGISRELPHISFLVSPALEHNLSQKAWRILATEVKSVWPRIQLVNNPMDGRGEKFLGAWIEHHGQNPHPGVDISSLDGMEGTDINVSKWLKNTKANKITFFWSRMYNCRNLGSFQDPRKRTSCPAAAHFEQFAHVMDLRPNVPSATLPCNVKPFKAPFIWKPLAEDKGTFDSRSNYPVAILPGKPSFYALMGAKGKRVGKLGFYGRFKGNLNRYYSGWKPGKRKTGYFFEKKAFDTQGSPYVWLRKKKSCYGPLIPGIRQGVYR